MTKNKGKTSSEVEPDTQTLQLNTFVDVQAFLLFEDEMAQESYDEDVIEAGEDMDEDTQADEEEHQSPPNIDNPEPSPAQETQESDSDSSSPELKKYDNILPLTERKLVKYLRKEAVKEDPALNKKVLEATEDYTVNSNNITELLSLAKTFDFVGLESLVKTVKAALDAQNDHLETWAKSSTSMAWNLGPRLTAIESSQAKIRSEISSLKSDTSEIKSMMTEIYQAFKEEAGKIRIDLKKIISAKAGEKFKKAKDAEMQWTISSRLKPEPITDVKIHPNSKPAALTVYRNNDKRNFDVHNPFKFTYFGLTELDELGPIIKKKKNTIVKDLMTSLGKRYERLKKIPGELGIHSALPAPVPEQD
ncbi:hypothetical protein Tco_0526598 [Tanacetum coccineum]